MKMMIKTVLSPVAQILRMIAAVLCPITKWLNYYMYKFAFIANWKVGKSPRWFDHDIDVYYLWDKRGETGWLERGFFSQFAIESADNPRVLELGCGDGFHTQKFYGKFSATGSEVELNRWGGGLVTACDISKSAIRRARRKHSAPHIKYMTRDFLQDMPEGDYTNVVWDASMNFFKASEIRIILSNIKKRLSLHQGVLSGVTVLNAQWEYYKIKFASPEEVEHLLGEFFENVTTWKKGSQLYFFASDGTLPFSFSVRRAARNNVAS